MVKDATYWAEQIREGKISTKELILAIKKRVMEKNPQLNALITFDEEQTLTELVTKKWTVDQPFAGVPIPLKLLGQEKKGWLNTSGSRLFKENHSLITDHFVQGLEQSGFVPLGKTNAPEFGFKNITDPSLYGPTRNPWNLEHYSGGSSGGAASAVASGMFPIAGASDGGGSIRIPASFSGLIGLKPTRGSMPTGPNGWRGWQGASINFALTISMRDTARLFDSLHGNHLAAPYQGPHYSKRMTQELRVPKAMKIAWCQSSPIGSAVSLEAQLALAESLKFLEKAGHELVEIRYPIDGIALMDSYYQMNGAETAAMMNEIEASLGRQLVYEDMEPMTWTLYQYGKGIKASEYVQALALWDQAAAVMERIFEDYDLFLSPTTAETAPAITTDLQSEEIRSSMSQAAELSQLERRSLVTKMFEKSLVATPYTQLANLTGQPAISLPVYVSPSGLPLGIQFMASKGREDLLIGIGFQFEQQEKFLLPNYYQEKRGEL